ncbi:MAG: hypothetical protein ACKOYN_01695 [Planctomycetota bacterium]
MKCIVSASLSIVGALALSAHAPAALVGSYVVGSGSSASFVQIEFANANAYLYEVRYDGAMFGDDLFAIIAQAQPGFFSYVTQSFSFGDALFGIAIGGDANEGFGNPPAYLDYWHYWTREASELAWTESWTGFGDRAVTNGSWDGWVFNSNAAPATVPAPGTVVAIALSAAWTGTQRHRGSRRR